MKKIACILGSPRVNGNTETIARKFIEIAQGLGAEAEIFALNKMNYKGCQACLACKTKLEECAVKDDLSEALRAAREADILIIASPVYFGQFTAQMKAVLDRMYSFLKPNYLSDPNPTRLVPGKKCLFIFTQGSPDAGTFDMYSEYSRWFEWFGYENYLIRGVGTSTKTAAAESEALMQQTVDLAKQLMA